MPFTFIVMTSKHVEEKGGKFSAMTGAEDDAEERWHNKTSTQEFTLSFEGGSFTQ